MKLLKFLGNLLAVAVMVLVAAFLVVMAMPARAAGSNANLTWTLPNQYTDDSPLPASDIAEVVIEWRRTAAGPLVGSQRVPGAATSATVPGLVCGDFVFQVAVVTTSTARYPSTAGQQSAPPTAYATGIRCTPKSVTGVTAS